MASGPSLFRLLREAAPKLSRHFFTCSNRAKPVAPNASKSIPTSNLRSIRQTPYLKAFRSQSTLSTQAFQQRAKSSAPQLGIKGETLIGKLANARSVEEKGGYFPETSRRIVAWWLIGSAASVFGIVVFGGLTRLTESGLSITEWRPVTGSLPPFTTSRWLEEFDLYKASPEYRKINPNMDLTEFKKIYWMEWTHRQWGRFIGLSFVIPAVYFVIRKRVSRNMVRNLGLISGLIAMQGFVGWWMVKSGLTEDLFAEGAHPRVSQYRLTVHLGLAFSVYVSMLWNGLSILREHHFLNNTQPNRAQYLIQRLKNPQLSPFRYTIVGLGALVFTTAMSGGLVAGLDAGLIYNEFPYMGLGLTPPKSELWSSFYSRQQPPHSDLWWRNMLENPSLVQLDHRILATSTFTAVNGLWAYMMLSSVVKKSLPRGARIMMHGTLGLVYMQVALGLTTLLYLVPLPAASAHQAGSLALLTGVVLLGHRVSTPRRLVRLVERRNVLMREEQAKAKRFRGGARNLHKQVQQK